MKQLRLIILFSILSFVGNCEGYGGTIGVIGYTYGKN